MQTERQRKLSTAEERRETVLRTAIGAFAARGYFGTTTTEVAKAAGISQAYVYRLFPNKEALFAAVVEHCFTQVRAPRGRGAAPAAGGSPPQEKSTTLGGGGVRLCFPRSRAGVAGAAAEAEGASPELVLASMGDAYARLISDNDLLLVQLHAQAAAVSEPVIRDAVRAGYARVVEYVRGASGGDERQVQEFFAIGMLCHLVVSLGVGAGGGVEGAGGAVGADGVEEPWMRTLAAGITHY
ncbi:TetR/AcrR family transcriptional regulator [Streptomyces sp. NPDC059851]|uniref:TetR/AcrR family transcriptional regulator n=1 Tax=Streptomyces sp. NPDC059851 TaxID=3346971 RepID=UPI003654F87F